MPALRRGDTPGRAGWLYTPELGAVIADAVSEGVSIPEQHACTPDAIPPPTIVAAWRRQHPEFAVMLRHADSVRAELLVEQALQVADHAPGAAPRVALMVSVRMAMAERLDRRRWGKDGTGEPDSALRAEFQPVAIGVSDDELAALAVGSVRVAEPVEPIPTNPAPDAAKAGEF